MKNNLYDSLTVDQLPNADIELVAKNCGLEVAVSLLQNMPGISISVPKAGLKEITREFIQRNYTGKNMKELALRCNLSLSHAYRLLKSGKEDGDGRCIAK